MTEDIFLYLFDKLMLSSFLLLEKHQLSFLLDSCNALSYFMNKQYFSIGKESFFFVRYREQDLATT